MTVTSNGTGLTLGVLLEEPLCRQIRADGPIDPTAPVRWCVPLDEALEADELSDLVVFVGPRDQPLTREVVERLATGGVTAVLVREDAAPETADLLSCWKRQRPTFLIADRGLRYGQVNWLVAQKVLTQKAHALEYGVTIHERLAELLYRGAGLAAMAQQLSRLSGCSVILLDTHFETLAYESLTTMPVPDPAEVTRLVCEVIDQGGLPPASDVRGKAVTVDVRLENGPVECVVCPMVLGGTTYGWLLLVELTASPGRHALAQHLVSAEQSATVIGSEMLRLRSVAEAEERARGDFLHALLHDRFSDSHELMARSEHHHFDITATFGVVVATGVFDVSSPTGIEQQWNLARSFRSSRGPSSPWMMATAVGGLLVIVRQLVSAGTGGHRAEEELALFAVDLHGDLGERAGPQLRVSYGRPGVGASGVAASYRNARVTMAVAEHVGLAPVCGYAELRVFATLAGLASTPEGEEFAKEVLAPLRKTRSTDDLEKVVMAYIQQGGNLIAAARALQMHRNTVLYKLNRAATLLNMDMRVAENRFTLWLAHRLDLLSRVQNAVVGQELGLP
jgi:sugar diacid utilization regulator